MTDRTIITVILRDEVEETLSSWGYALLPYRMRLHQFEDGWLLMQWEVDDVGYDHDDDAFYITETHRIDDYFRRYVFEFSEEASIPAEQHDEAYVYMAAENSAKGRYFSVGLVDGETVCPFGFGGLDFDDCPFDVRFTWNVDVRRKPHA